MFAIGASVLVPRSDGTESVGTVIEFESDTDVYTVEIGGAGSTSSLKKRVLGSSLSRTLV
jgi:hypothetical protein